MSYFAPQNILSKLSRENCMSKLRKLPPITMGSALPTNTAAVLVPLCVVDNRVSLLYTLRSSNLNNHRGQISFPGGKSDPSDESLTFTALRETDEEIGYPRDKVEVWGEANTLPGRDNKLAITPVIGYLPDLKLTSLKPSTHEVEEVFTVPLEELCDPNKCGHTIFRNSFILPVFTYENKKIWGLTAIITNMFLSCLISQEHYRNDFKNRKIQIIDSKL